MWSRTPGCPHQALLSPVTAPTPQHPAPSSGPAAFRGDLASSRHRSGPLCAGWEGQECRCVSDSSGVVRPVARDSRHQGQDPCLHFCRRHRAHRRACRRRVETGPGGAGPGPHELWACLPACAGLGGLFWVPVPTPWSPNKLHPGHSARGHRFLPQDARAGSWGLLPPPHQPSTLGAGPEESVLGWGAAECKIHLLIHRSQAWTVGDTCLRGGVHAQASCPSGGPAPEGPRLGAVHLCTTKLGPPLPLCKSSLWARWV